ncbi:hypothetical protein IAT38_002067 [Cryptococcus sp. DSM 104549]
MSSSNASASSSRRVLRSLFTEDACSHFLVSIFDRLDLADIPSFIRVNHHINSVFTSSSHLQLRYRCAYHSLPSSFPLSTPGHVATSAERLSTVLEHEERLDNVRPTEIRCLHFQNGDVTKVQDGHILVSECINKMPLDEDDEDFEAEYLVDGWSVWKMRSPPGWDGEARGGKKVQGMWRWKSDFGFPIDCASMCVEDNVIAVARSVDHPPCESIPPHSTIKVIHRIYFYTLVPPKGTPVPQDGVFSEPIVHPDAKLPFIELLIPARFHLHHCDVQVAPGGKVALRLVSVDNAKLSFLGFWDWKHGVSIGKAAPTAQNPVVDDFAFLGPFVICSTLRDVVRGSELEAPSLMEAVEDGATGEMRHVIRGENGHGSPHKSAPTKTIPKPPPKQSSIYDDIDYDSEEEILQSIGRAGPTNEIFYALDTFGLLPPARGLRPLAKAHSRYTKPGYDPSKPCTWDYDDLPYCMPLASFELPTLNLESLPSANNPLEALMDTLKLDTDFRPSRCVLGDFQVDDALLRGDRKAMMPFTISGYVADGMGGESQARCAGMVDLQAIIRLTQAAMRSHMAECKGVTLKLQELGAKLSRKTWEDQYREAVHLFLSLDDGWETDEEEEDNPFSYLNFLNPGTAKSKAPRKAKPAPKKPKKASSYKWLNPFKLEWHFWEDSVSLRFVPIEATATYGTRAITVEPVPDAKPVVRRKDGMVLLRTWMIVRDYNSRTLKDDPRNPRRVLGGLPPTPVFPSVSSSTPAAWPSSSPPPPSSNGKGKAKEGDRPRVIKCPLQRPLPVGQMDNDVVSYDTSARADMRVWTKHVFEKEYMQSKLGYKESRAKVLIDVLRPLHGVHWDGKTVVLGTESGAHVFTF